MADILPYLGVAQSFEADEAAGQKITLDDLTGMNRGDAEKILKEQSLTAVFVGEGDTVTGQIPSVGETVPGGSQVLVYLGEEPESRTTQVPDFLGMNRQQASDAANQAGLYILVTGNGEADPNVTVTTQSVPAGSEITQGTTIVLEFIDTRVSD